MATSLSSREVSQSYVRQIRRIPFFICIPRREQRHVTFIEPSPKRPRNGRLVKKALGYVSIAVVALMGMIILVPSALANGPASWLSPPIEVVTHSTRATIEVELASERLATEWKAEYATAASCPVPSQPSEGCQWTVVNSGETEAGVGSNAFYHIWIGEEGPRGIQLHHLVPDTSYYARFIAKNADNSSPADETVPFKTRPVEDPEILRTAVDEEGHTSFENRAITDTVAEFTAEINTNGAQTEYSFEYSLPENGRAPKSDSFSWKSFTSDATGTITDEQAKVGAELTGLTPETTYYVRLKATNVAGGVEQYEYYVGGTLELTSFVTGTAKPFVKLEIRNITAESAHFSAEVVPHGSETGWRLEYAPAESGGEAPSENSHSWITVPGGEGTISKAQAEAIPYNNNQRFGVQLTGLHSSTVYYVRLPAETSCAVGCGKAVSGIVRFETSGPPAIDSFTVHALHGESFRLLGAVNPKSLPTSAEQTITVSGATGGTFTLSFEGHTTKPIVYNAPSEGPGSVQLALEELAGVQVGVEGVAGGPYTVFFHGSNGGVAQPPITADSSGLTSGSVAVVVLQRGGDAYHTRYRFQYATVDSVNERGWTGAGETEQVEAGLGETFQVVGGDVPGLKSGQEYRYRLVADNEVGDSAGVEQTLVVPSTVPVGEGVSCSNEGFRTGLSARLPDCRAYEQVSPLDKQGAQEPFSYRGGVQSAVFASENGEHAVLEAPQVSYGLGAGAGQGPYLFSRVAGKGWSVTAGAPQPETGVYNVDPQVYSGDLTRIAFAAEYFPSPVSESPDVEYRIGPLGGPYTTVASVPHKEVTGVYSEGWVGADGDLSKLVLQTRDRSLLGGSTGTRSGSDLYEYTASGGLRQLNVTATGATIGSCGATLAHGVEEGAQYHRLSGPNSVSADGSRVFFEAVPGRECEAPKNLYMSVNGEETVEIGTAKLMGADVQGTTLLIEDVSGKLLGYDTGTGMTVSQSDTEVETDHELGLLGIPVRTEPRDSEPFYHPRYTYFTGIVAGLPSGGIIVEGVHEGKQASQVYRYDNVDRLVECVSCASASSPEPKQEAFLDGIQGVPSVNGGLPIYTAASANGDFAFFTTVAALTPGDVDGEIPAETLLEFELPPKEYVNTGSHTSPSTDVYEWRRSGVGGCVQPQGCVALITDGRGGYLNLLLGTANEGRDVFFYTRSKLLSQDNDTAGDIYDARIGGGLPGPPARPVECEGDACSTPPSPPNDTTPSSLTSNGAGNVSPPSSAKPTGTHKKAKKKTKKKVKKKSNRKVKGKGKAKKAVRSKGLAGTRGRGGGIK
jgi:hypothetical protein